MATTYERLKKIVVEQLGVDEDEVKPEASFVDDLNADSLDLVELIMSLEEEFGTEISDEDAEQHPHRRRRRRIHRRAHHLGSAPDRHRGPARDRGPGRRPRRAPRPPGSGSALLAQALTHTSWLHEHPGEAAGHNERLEFLGDAVINLADLRGPLRPPPRRRRGRAVRAPRRDRERHRPRRARRRASTSAPYLPLGEGEAQSRRPTPAVDPRLGASRRWPARCCSTSAGTRRATGSCAIAAPEIDASLAPIAAQEPEEPPPGADAAMHRRAARLPAARGRRARPREGLPRRGQRRRARSSGWASDPSRRVAETAAAAEAVQVLAAPRGGGARPSG